MTADNHERDRAPPRMLPRGPRTCLQERMRNARAESRSSRQVTQVRQNLRTAGLVRVVDGPASQLLDRGAIESVHIGRLRRIPVDSLTDFVDACRREQQARR